MRMRVLVLATLLIAAMVAADRLLAQSPAPGPALSERSGSKGRAGRHLSRGRHGGIPTCRGPGTTRPSRRSSARAVRRSPVPHGRGSEDARGARRQADGRTAVGRTAQPGGHDPPGVLDRSGPASGRRSGARRSSSIRQTAACRRSSTPVPGAAADVAVAGVAAAPARPGGRADSWTDRSLLERCITWGIATASLPGLYNNNIQIVQSPDSRRHRPRDGARRARHSPRRPAARHGKGRPRATSSANRADGSRATRWSSRPRTSRRRRTTAARTSNLKLTERYRRVDARPRGAPADGRGSRRCGRSRGR